MTASPSSPSEEKRLASYPMEMEVGGEGGAGEMAFAVERLFLGAVEVVVDPDRETQLKELEDGVGADEAGAAGDQHGPHDLQLADTTVGNDQEKKMRFA